MIEAHPPGFVGPDAPSASVYDACIRCGLCLPTCPTYLETMTETSGPRGRISLIKAVADGKLDLLSPGFVGQMSECLDCRACEAVCPSGVRYGSLVENARAQIERAQAPHRAPRERLLRWFSVHVVFSNLWVMRMLASLVRVVQRCGMMPLARLIGAADAAALAPRIPDRFFVASDQRIDVPKADGLALLHTGCVMQVAFPHVHEATVRMLGRARLSVVVPRAQGCCGALAVHAGDRAFGRELAKRNIIAFERSGADVYVVNAAGCGSMLKEYGELFSDDPSWRERARAFSSRVRDITEVLDAVDLDPRIGTLDADVTYQEACHLVHAQRVSAAPRRLLASIPGVRLTEMRESSVCCGSAGTYNLTEPQMAARLSKRKVERIAETRANIVATTNPGCAMQITAGLHDAGLDVEVRHVVELLDTAYAAYDAAVTRA